jgi:hypothetical protein
MRVCAVVNLILITSTAGAVAGNVAMLQEWCMDSLAMLHMSCRTPQKTLWQLVETGLRMCTPEPPQVRLN